MPSLTWHPETIVAHYSSFWILNQVQDDNLKKYAEMAELAYAHDLPAACLPVGRASRLKIATNK